MENEVLKLASSQGIWAALTVFLIFYILKVQEKRDTKQEEREKNYQEIISKLTEKLGILESIENNVEDIRNKIYRKKTEGLSI